MIPYKNELTEISWFYFKVVLLYILFQLGSLKKLFRQGYLKTENINKIYGNYISIKFHINFSIFFLRQLLQKQFFISYTFYLIYIRNNLYIFFQYFQDFFLQLIYTHLLLFHLDFRLYFQ